MTRTIVIANQKGGVGKSTTVANLGRALTEKGKKVLLIDLDPQGGLSASFGVNSYDVQRSTYSLLMKPQSSLARVLRVVGDHLALAPASADLSTAEILLGTKADGVTRLREALAHNLPNLGFDFILIDTPPTLSTLTVNGLVAADELLIPIQAHYLSMRGVRGLLDTVNRLKERNINPNLRLLGVVATMHRPDSETSKEVVEEIKSTFGDEMFQTVLQYDETVAEAPIAGQSLLDYAGDHVVANAYRALAGEILNHG